MKITIMVGECPLRNRTAHLSCDTLQHIERTHDVGPSVGSHARRSCRPAGYRLLVGVVHEPITITQHPLPRP